MVELVSTEGICSPVEPVVNLRVVAISAFYDEGSVRGIRMTGDCQQGLRSSSAYRKECIFHRNLVYNYIITEEKILYFVAL